MLLTHLEGEDQQLELKKKFEVELEVVCLNSDFFDIKRVKKDLVNVINVCKQLPEQTILKESIEHTPEVPYYEFSLFCNKEDLNYYRNLLSQNELQVDIIHDNHTGDELGPLVNF